MSSREHCRAPSNEAIGGRVSTRFDASSDRFVRDTFEALAGIIVAVVCQVVSPLVVAYAIDRGVVDRDTAIVAACTLVMAFLVAGQVGGSYFEQRAMGRFAQHYLADLRRRLLDHLHVLDLDYFAREQAGRVVARLTSDVESLQQFLQSGLSLLVRGILLVTLATIVMLTQSWQLTLAVLAILPVLALASRWYRPRAFDVQLGFRESMANLLNHVNEALVGMRVVQAYGIESQQRGTFADINDATYNARMRERPRHLDLLRDHRVPAPSGARDRRGLRRSARRPRRDRGRHLDRVHAVSDTTVRADPAVHGAQHIDAGGECRVHPHVRVPRAPTVVGGRVRRTSLPVGQRCGAARTGDVPVCARRAGRGLEPRSRRASG